MLFKKIKISKCFNSTRLVKKAEFLGGFETPFADDNFLSVYMNPTGREIEEAKGESSHGSIRGVINEDGTTYCWNGDILHNQLPTESGVNVGGSGLLRFAFDNREWIFDLHFRTTFNEGFKKVIKHENILSNFGDLNADLCFFYADDDGLDYLGQNNIYLANDNMVIFKGIENLKQHIQNKNGARKISRLKKLAKSIESELIDGYKPNDIYRCKSDGKRKPLDDVFFIYLNPTSSEVNEIKKNSPTGSVRGLITGNGIYMWPGETMHDDINDELRRSGVNLKLDVDDEFRFAYEGAGVWKFDTGWNFELIEAMEKAVANKQYLQSIGGFGGEIGFYHSPSGCLYHPEAEYQYIVDNYMDKADISCSDDYDSVLFFSGGLDVVEKFVNEFKSHVDEFSYDDVDDDDFY